MKKSKQKLRSDSLGLLSMFLNEFPNLSSRMSDSFDLVSLSGQAQLTCTACGIEFEDAADHRDHFRAEWHVYNTKRRVAGLQPISETTWEEKLEKIKSQQDSVQSQIAEKTGKKKVERSEMSTSNAAPAVIDELTCFFDNLRFESLEDNLAHMSLKHSFYVPYVDWVSDWTGLLTKLCSRILTDHQCVTCGKRFRTAYAVQGHMADSGHSRINLDDEELIDSLESFYDFSTKEEIVDELDILEDGSLQLPSGATLTHRDFAYIYKQKVTERREKVAKARPGLPSLLNVGPGGGTATALLPSYTLKRLAKQLARAMKVESDRYHLKVGVRNNKTMRRSYRSSIVEMYSYGK